MVVSSFTKKLTKSFFLKTLLACVHNAFVIVYEHYTQFKMRRLFLGLGQLVISSSLTKNEQDRFSLTLLPCYQKQIIIIKVIAFLSMRNYYSI